MLHPCIFADATALLLHLAVVMYEVFVDMYIMIMIIIILLLLSTIYDVKRVYIYICYYLLALKQGH